MALHHNLPLPNVIATYRVYAYQFIDDLSYMKPLEANPDGLPYEAKSIQAIKDLFAAHGWNGDGEIQMTWVPPFILPDGGNDGLILFHVKQDRGGVSWIASRYTDLSRLWPALAPYDDIAKKRED